MTLPIRLGALARDGNHHPVQVETGILTQDGNSTPNVSPQTITSSVKQLVVPDKAVALSFVSVGADVRFTSSGALNGAASNNGYDVAAANTRTTIGVAGLEGVNFVRDASTNCSLAFHFKLLE